MKAKTVSRTLMIGSILVGLMYTAVWVTLLVVI